MELKGSNFRHVAGALPYVLVLTVVAMAGSLDVTHTFTPGTVADANQVNQNFVDVENAVTDNHDRLTALENLLANGGIVRAAASIRTMTDGTVTVVRSFSNLPGSPAVSVSRTDIGVYNVHFGANVSGRYYSATLGAPGGVPVGPPFPVDTPHGSIEVTPQLFDENGLLVRTFDDNGAFTDAQFYVVVY